MEVLKIVIKNLRMITGALSIKELVNKIDLNKNINFNIATCGIPQDAIKDYL